jgi:hypothetical protein
LLQSTLRKVLTDEGQLVTALGGKLAGKSFIMENLTQEMNENGELHAIAMRGERAADPWLHRCSPNFPYHDSRIWSCSSTQAASGNGAQFWRVWQGRGAVVRGRWRAACRGCAHRAR